MLRFNRYIKISVLLAICLFFQDAKAQDPNNLFLEGNKFFQEGDFEKSINNYEMVLKSGSESAALYYNLGNAHFQSGGLSEAILYYEKAKKINPVDKDVLYNLKLANTRVVDKIEVIPDFFFVDWYNNLVRQHSTDFWAYSFTFLFLLSLLSFTLYFFQSSRGAKKAFFVSSFLLLFVSVCFYFLANSRYAMESQNKEAIIFAENSYIKSAPSESSQDVFILHEGTKVKVIEEVDGWNEILLADGKRGWIESESLKEI
jgi:tetratricopeptide (TPR) repeat protein